MSIDTVYRSFCNYLTGSGIAGVLSRCDGVACAFSGGADSALLLTLLRRYCAENDCPLTALHVHHGIRGEAADADAAFSETFCGERNIPFRLCRVDVPQYIAEHHCGLEEGARILRYRAIENAVPEKYAIATAHNATDQVETVLFHLCRGSGIDGLCGISPVRGRIVRPLLFLPSDEIRAVCAAERIPYVVDETNLTNDCTRNYIRHEIVPRLEKVHPGVENAVRQMAELIREDSRVLAGIADEVLTGDPGRADLLALSEGIRSRVLRTMYEKASGRTELARRHIDAMTELLRGGRVNGALSLPGGICFRLERDSVTFTKERDAVVNETVFYPSGEGIWENERYFLTLTRASQKNQENRAAARENIYKISMQQRIDFAKIKGVPRVRTRTEGDTIRYGGMTRRVKKLFSDRKLPLIVRNTLPILLDDDGILWLPGFPPRDGTGVPNDSPADAMVLCLWEKHFDKHHSNDQSQAVACPIG